MSLYIWDKASQELVPIAGLVNINDGTSASDTTWSSQKVSAELEHIKRVKFAFPTSGAETTVVSDTSLFGNYVVVGYSVKSKSTGNYVNGTYRQADVMIKATGLVVANYEEYYRGCESYALLIKIADL